MARKLVAPSPARRTRPSLHPAPEVLESRIAPATFTGAATALTIDLNTLHEHIAFSTDGTSITAILTGGTATDGGGTGGHVAGFGTATATITSSAFTVINVTDSAGDTSVLFATSSGIYPQAFTVNLNDPASADITFSGSSTFSETLNLTTTAGFVSSDAASSLTLTGAANLAVAATGHDILFKGAVAVAGTTSLAGGAIQIDNPANDFTGALQLTGPAAASVFDVNALILAPSNLNFGALNQTTHIGAGGDITQTGALTANGTGTLALSSLAGSITLSNAANALSNTTTLSLSVTGTHDATFVNAGVTQLGDITLDTGTLSLSSTGNVSQHTGTTIHTAGPTTLAINLNANRNIILNNVGNHLAGPVTVNEVGGGTLQDFSLRNADDHAAAPTGAALTTAGDVRNLTLNFDNNGLVLPGYNITGNLNVTAGGDITQAAALSVGGSTTATVTGDFTISLIFNANAFTGAVSLNAPQSAQPMTVVNGMAMILGPSDLGHGSFSATTVTGNITETGAITQEKGAGPATFTVPTGGSISLTNNANHFPGAVIFANANTVNFHNADFQADFSELTLAPTVNTLTVVFNNAPIVLPTLSETTLTINAQGIVQKTGATLSVSGQATFNGNAFPVNLANAGNDFTNVTVANSSRNEVSLNDVNGFTFTGTSTLGSGRLTVTAGGTISETGIISQTTSLGAVGDASFTVTNGGLALGGANIFAGSVSVAVSGSNTTALNNTTAPLTLGDVTTGPGAFTATADTAGIFQDPNSVLSLGGPSSFNSAGTIALTNHTNAFAGDVALSGTDVSLRATGPVALATGAVTGTLSVTTGGKATDSVTQSGAIIGNSTATFDAGAGNVLLTNAANRFNQVSVFSTGTAVAITDVNALAIGPLKLGPGTLDIITGGNLTSSGSIIQAAGAGAITLTTPAGNDIILDNDQNALHGTLNVVHSTNVAIYTGGDLPFAPGSTITGDLDLTAGGNLTLPANLSALTELIVSAKTIPFTSDVTVTGGTTTLTGQVTFTGDRTFTTTGPGISFSGDVTTSGALTLNVSAGDAVVVNGGIWNEGAHPLTINGVGVDLIIGNNSPAVFAMTSGTISLPGGGVFTVSAKGTLAIGATTAAETVTVTNGAGSLMILGALSVGFGATNDQLIKTGPGAVILGAAAQLVGSGLADAGASPILVSQTGLLTGHFVNSVDASGAPHDFFAGSDIVTPAYDFTQLTVKSGGVAAPNGTISGFFPDGDKFTVTSSLGASSGLTIVQEVSGALGIVVRNATATGASTLGISTIGGGDGWLPIDGVAVHAPGSVSIAAPAGDFSGSLTTAGALTSLVAHDLGSSTSTLSVLDGGLATAKTSITAHTVQQTTMNLQGSLDKFKAVSVASGVRITAAKFGTIATTGDPNGTAPLAPGAPKPGDFGATLTSTTTANGVVLTSATVTGTLSGFWDLRGSVGSATAGSANTWVLGSAPNDFGAKNSGLLTDVKKLALGTVTTMGLNAMGMVSAMTTSDITTSFISAGSFGTIAVKANPALGLAGTVSSSIFTATGNLGGTALAGLTVAGDLSNSQLNFLDGDVKSIVVSHTLASDTLLGTNVDSRGNFKAITVGAWQSSSVDARTVGTLKVAGNLAAGLLGDFTGSTITLRGNANGVALATFSAQGSVTGSTFDVQNGNVTSFKAGRQLGTTTVQLTDAAFGTLGTIQAAEWTGGVSVVAKTIGTVASVGAPAANPASPLLLGGMNGDTITAYLNSGTTVAIGKLSTKGDLTSTTIRAGHGITSAIFGRMVSSSFIVADDAVTGALNVGRIATLTAGAWTTSLVSANTLGAVKITGYAMPESSAASFQFGDASGTFLAQGSEPGKSTGIDSFSVARNFTNGTLHASSGIKTLTIGGSDSVSTIVTENPLAPANGFIGTFFAGDLNSATIRAGSIQTAKTTGSVPLGLLGNITNSNIALNSGVTVAGASQALGSLTLTGDFADSVLDAPASVGKIDIRGRVTTVTAGARIQAGYAVGAKLGSLSAGAWGEPGVNLTTDLVSQSVGTFTLKGNTARSFTGTADHAFIDILGAANGVGLGTFSATGTASNSLFRVSDGNVTSFTVQRLVSSDLLVGFHPVKGSDITQTTTAAQWSATDHTLGSFKTTAPFDPTDASDSASFVDSNVIAGILGTINVSGVNTASLNSTAFGIAFRTSAGTGGTVKINGSATALTPPTTIGQFNYLGLAG